MTTKHLSSPIQKLKIGSEKILLICSNVYCVLVTIYSPNTSLTKKLGRGAVFYQVEYMHGHEQRSGFKSPGPYLLGSSFRSGEAVL